LLTRRTPPTLTTFPYTTLFRSETAGGDTYSAARDGERTDPEVLRLDDPGGAVSRGPRERPRDLGGVLDALETDKPRFRVECHERVSLNVERGIPKHPDICGFRGIIPAELDLRPARCETDVAEPRAGGEIGLHVPPEV